MVRAELGAALVATDFDGTLSPIVDDPAAAVLVEGAEQLLIGLSGAAAEVAVISGRPLSYLQSNLPAGLTMVGLYGLESIRHGRRADHPEAERWRDVVAGVVAEGEATAPGGVRVESKGLSVTLHYRGHPELAVQVAGLAAALAAPSGLVVRPARMSVELHPPVDEDKGTVLERLAADHDGPVVFCGDDVGDLAAFDALDRLALSGRPVARVVARSEETDDRLLERADVVVEGPAGTTALLSTLVP